MSHINILLLLLCQFYYYFNIFAALQKKGYIMNMDLFGFLVYKELQQSLEHM